MKNRKMIRIAVISSLISAALIIAFFQFSGMQINDLSDLSRTSELVDANDLTDSSDSMDISNSADTTNTTDATDTTNTTDATDADNQNYLIPSKETSNLYPLKDKELNTLAIERLILTPDTEATQAVRLTFNLLEAAEQVSVVVVNDSMELVNIYEPTFEQVTIDSDESNKLNTYKATLDGLEAGMRYSYVVQVKDTYSELYSFNTIKEDAITTLVLLGDAQGYSQKHYNQLKKTFEMAQKVRESGDTIDITLLAGDIVDQGDAFDQWGFFDIAMKDYLRTSLFMSTLGNHDAASKAIVYKSSFNYPKNGIHTLDELSYYIDLPNARIAVWDTESVATFEEQGKWLTDSMHDVPDKFKLVLMHRSAYPMAYDEAYIRDLSRYFEEADIDLVLSGHDHIYNRTTMLKDKKIDINKGVTYLVSGSPSGSKFYDEIKETNRYWKEVVYDENNSIFTLITIDADSISVKAYAIEENKPVLIDSFLIE